MEISDGSDVVGLFNALAKMDLDPLNRESIRSRRSEPEGSLFTSLNSAFISCAMVFVAFGVIITRKRPAIFRPSRINRNNRSEGNLV